MNTYPLLFDEPALVSSTGVSLTDPNWVDQVDHVIRHLDPKQPDFIARGYCALLDSSLKETPDKWFCHLFKLWLDSIGIPRDSIAQNIDVSGSDGKNVDCDFIIKAIPERPACGLLLKTSMRERWKQWDRDADAASTRYRYHSLFVTQHVRKDPYFVAATYHERPKGPDRVRKSSHKAQKAWRQRMEFKQEEIARVSKIGDRLLCRNLRLITVHEYEKMAGLEVFLRRGIVAPWLW